ncbi:hypothetical protein DFH09DRAFT_929930 [Mycena vulgaris]|nr:hypothetical protein DFH09DRAFT_929930 [Mycena vulgaris]
MAATCVPRNNPKAANASRLRSFVMPTKFLERGVRKKSKTYKIDILTAVVMDKDVIIITDFARMSQLHVVSSATVLQWSVSSLLWNSRLWKRFRGGLDWIVERDAALVVLDSWQARVLREKDPTAIIDVLLDAGGPGVGIGQHLANDLLFGIALHPDTPSLAICLSDNLYNELRHHNPIFMATFTSPVYLQRCAGRPNSNNPFIFHEVSNTNFLRGFVRVYRKLEVQIEATLYDVYQSRGLFDPTHKIGMPYHGIWTPTTQKFKVVKVQLFEGSQNNRYHVIWATPPAIWNACTEATPFRDVTNAGFATTLGPASFFEPMQNKLRHFAWASVASPTSYLHFFRRFSR